MRPVKHVVIQGRKIRRPHLMPWYGRWLCICDKCIGEGPSFQEAYDDWLKAHAI